LHQLHRNQHDVSVGTIRYKKATDGGPNDIPMPWDWESITASPDSSKPGTSNGVFTATGNYMTVAFNLGGRAQTSNNTQPGYFWVDNVSLTTWPPTTEPVFTNAMQSGSDLVVTALASGSNVTSGLRIHPSTLSTARGPTMAGPPRSFRIHILCLQFPTPTHWMPLRMCQPS